MAKKSWAEKLQTGTPKVEVLEKAGMGWQVGQKLFIPTPLVIKAEVDKLKPGTTTDPKTIREQLAKANNADGTCALVTGISFRIIAELALEQLAAGKSRDEVSPFWRVVDPNSPLAKKLSCGPEFIVQQRQIEN